MGLSYGPLCCRSSIGNRQTKLKELNKQFGVPSARRRLEPIVEVALVAEQLEQDTTMSNGYRAVTDLLRIDGVAIPR